MLRRGEWHDTWNDRREYTLLVVKRHTISLTGAMPMLRTSHPAGLSVIDTRTYYSIAFRIPLYHRGDSAKLALRC